MAYSETHIDDCSKGQSISVGKASTDAGPTREGPREERASEDGKERRYIEKFSTAFKLRHPQASDEQITILATKSLNKYRLIKARDAVRQRGTEERSYSSQGASIKEANSEGLNDANPSQAHEINKRAATMRIIFDHIKSHHPQASDEQIRRMSVQFLGRYRLSVTHDGCLSWDNGGRYDLSIRDGNPQASSRNGGHGDAELRSIGGVGISPVLQALDRFRHQNPYAGDDQIRTMLIDRLQHQFSIYKAHTAALQVLNRTSSSNGETLVKEERPNKDTSSDLLQVITTNDTPPDLQHFFNQTKSRDPNAGDEQIWRSKPESLEQDRSSMPHTAAKGGHSGVACGHGRPKPSIKEDIPEENDGQNSDLRVSMKQEIPEHKSPDSSSPRTLLCDTTPTPPNPLGSRMNRARLSALRQHRKRTHAHDNEGKRHLGTHKVKLENMEEGSVPTIKQESPKDPTTPKIK